MESGEKGPDRRQEQKEHPAEGAATGTCSRCIFAADIIGLNVNGDRAADAAARAAAFERVGRRGGQAAGVLVASGRALPGPTV